MYKYYIYGLVIVSEIKLYQLEQCTCSTQDVLIRYGKVEPKIEQYVREKMLSGMSPDRVWFYNDIGYFVIKNGNEIIVQANKDATQEDVASFLLGWSIAFLFMQRGNAAIHCSALEMNHRAVLIAGNSGAGKSTITLNLLKKGYKYLADDIAMVDTKNDFMIQPGFPQQKVCRNVAETMDVDKLFYINEKKDKFAYTNIEEFCTEPQKLSTIFVMDTYDGEDVIFEKLKGLAKWNSVINNLFLNDAYTAFGLTAEERRRCLEIAGSVDIYAIHRPKNKDTVEEICSQIIEILN